MENGGPREAISVFQPIFLPACRFQDQPEDADWVEADLPAMGWGLAGTEIGTRQEKPEGQKEGDR